MNIPHAYYYKNSDTEAERLDIEEDRLKATRIQG
jgi:hypothetical protein